MSNFIKSFLVSGEQEKRVIDYNELIKAKIGSDKFVSAGEAGADEKEDGTFFAGLTADVVEVLEQPEGEEAEAAVAGEAAAIARQMSDEQLIRDAESEAERIISEAKAESEAMWNRAFESAKQEGYEDGMKEGNLEIERLRREVMREKERQQEEYTELLNTMESDLVSVILDVFSKVTGVLSEDKKDIILHLINRTLEGADNSKEFVVRVSGDDYKYVTEHKDEIYAGLLSGSTLEIVKDSTLSKNQCLIETDGGIFDCGLDTQMTNLIANIKALSCM